MKILQIILVLVISLSAKVGYISALKGDVSVERDNKTLKVKLGFELKEKDVISTASNGKVQIIFEDKTTIRLGRKSTLDIEKYFFDKSENSVSNFRVRNGFFDVVTGGISKYARHNFKLKLKTATIGIRGTHFQGYSFKDKNEVRCVGGAITLKIGDEVFDLVAGEKAKISKTGIKNKEKIDNTNLEKIYNIELDEAIIQVLDKIQNDDLARNLAQYGQAIGDAYKQIENIRDLMQQKYAKALLIRGIFESMYDNYLNEEYVLYKGEKVDLTDQFLENSEESFVKVGNFELDEELFWIDGRENYTDYISVTETMGGFAENGNFLPAWNGNGDSRKIGIYEGYFAGGDKSIANSPIAFTLDFGNRVVIPTFLLEDKLISLIEMNGLNQFGLQKLDLSYIDVHNFSDLMLGLITAFSNYYGENMEQIAGDIFVGTSSLNYYDLIFIAEQKEMLEVAKEQTGEDNIFSWGYWAYTDTDGTNKNRGGWILPKTEVTSQELIQEYALNSVSASYSGDVFGTYEKTNDVSPQKFENGNFHLNFNFGDNTINGNFNFEIDSSEYEVATTGSMLDSSSAFNLTGTNFIGDGQLFGETAENIGGGFHYKTINNEAVVGVFKGSQN